jgi:hypothetical protein
MAVRSHTAQYRQLREGLVASNAYSHAGADDVQVSLVDAFDAEGRPVKPKPRHALEASKTPPQWLHSVKPITESLIAIKSRSTLDRESPSPEVRTWVVFFPSFGLGGPCFT